MKNKRVRKTLLIGLSISSISLASGAIGLSNLNSTNSAMNVNLSKQIARKEAPRAADQTFIEPLAPIELGRVTNGSDLILLLPTQVTAIKISGTTMEQILVNVTWTAPSNEEMQQNTVNVVGKVNFENKDYSVTQVVNFTQTVDVAIKEVVVLQNQTYTFPDKGYIITTDGKIQETTVTFPDEGKPGTSELGEFYHKGTTADGRECQVKIRVINSAGLNSSNIKEKFESIKADWNGDGNGGNPNTNVQALYNGNISDKVLDNWQPRNQGEPREGFFNLTITLKQQEANLSELKVYYYEEKDNNSENPGPDHVKLSYKTTDGEYTDFTNYSCTLEGKILTFKFNEAITAKEVRFSFENTSGITGNNQNKYAWSCFSELELYQASDGEYVYGTALDLLGFKVNGIVIENFLATQKHYLGYFPYDAEEITIEPIFKQKGRFIVRPEGENFYRVFVFSEDLSKHDTYYITTQRQEAPLEKVEIRTPAKDSKIKAGEMINIETIGTTLRKEEVGVEQAKTVYTLENISGTASIQGNVLTPVNPGYISLKATMTYGGVTKESETYYYLIENSEVSFKVESVETVSTSIEVGSKPTLPETVTVTYTGGIEIEKNVSWNPIPDSYLTKPCQFLVQGTVQGIEEKASCIVTVTTKGNATQYLTLETMKNVVPTFPSQIIGSISTDGKTETTNLNIDSKYKDKSLYNKNVGETVEVVGTDANQREVKITVIIAEPSLSNDYADNMNGYPDIPHAFMENSDPSSNSNFANGTGGNKYLSKTTGTAAKFGFVFGNGGNLANRTFSKVIAEYEINDNVQSNFTIKLQKYTGTIDKSNITDDLVANWNDISNVPGNIFLDGHWEDIAASPTSMEAKPDNPSLGLVTFDLDEEVTTGAIRLVVTKDEGKAVSFTNLQVFQQVLNTTDTLPTLSALNVTTNNGTTNLLDSPTPALDLKSSYSYDVSKDVTSLNVVPVVDKSTTGNAYVLDDLGDNTVRILLTSASGVLTKNIEIKLNKESSSLVKFIANIENPQEIQAKNLEELKSKLPTTTKVQYLDGTSGELKTSYSIQELPLEKGTYTLYGQFELDPTVANSLNLQPTLKVTLTEDSTYNPAINPQDPSNNGYRIATIILGVLLGLTILGGLGYLTWMLIKNKKSKKTNKAN